MLHVLNKQSVDMQSIHMRLSKYKLRERGVSLIEVLVSIVILSVGILGLAQLQGNALKANNSAYMRAQASILAHEMLDVMRVDRDAARNQNYDGAYNAAPAVNGELVNDELSRWVSYVLARLPSSNAQIATANGIATITITWDDSRGENAPESFILRTRL